MTSIAASSGVFRNSMRIGFYLPNDGEMDPLPLLYRAWSLHKQCYLPVLDRLGSNRLWFSPYRERDPLKPNRYGIPEPARPAKTRVRAWELDLILAPLVAFDSCGTRLGMGGGYYDRSLGFLNHRRHWRRPRFYGLAYNFQMIPRLDSAAWDVPMDGCITDSQLYDFTTATRPPHGTARHGMT